LLAKASCQQTEIHLTEPVRQQAGSYRLCARACTACFLLRQVAAMQRDMFHCNQINVNTASAGKRDFGSLALKSLSLR